MINEIAQTIPTQVTAPRAKTPIPGKFFAHNKPMNGRRRTSGANSRKATELAQGVPQPALRKQATPVP